MKAIIEVAKRGSAISAARQQLSQTQNGQPIDYRLFFESAQSLFLELTPIRLELLNKLSQLGSCTIDTLVKTDEKNNASVRDDVIRLEELGLIETTQEGIIFVPFEAIEIVMPLAKAA
jgi:predicted transcriptional regulator